MIEAHQEEREAADAAEEAAAVEHDKRIVADVSARRIAKGKPALTPEQEASMIKDRAARRAAAKGVSRRQVRSGPTGLCSDWAKRCLGRE
jgi:hypothetical protein